MADVDNFRVDAFKRQYLIMYDLPYVDYGSLGVNTSKSGSIDTTGIQIGTGVQAAAIYRVFSQGEAIQTGRSLDVMIDGDGFFMVAEETSASSTCKMTRTECPCQRCHSAGSLITGP